MNNNIEEDTYRIDYCKAIRGIINYTLLNILLVKKKKQKTAENIILTFNIQIKTVFKYYNI